MRVDYSALYQAVDRVREAKRWSWYRVAKDTGISQSAFTRLKRGKAVNTTKLMTLAAWSGSDAASFISLDEK